MSVSLNEHSSICTKMCIPAQLCSAGLVSRTASISFEDYITLFKVGSKFSGPNLSAVREKIITLVNMYDSNASK